MLSDEVKNERKNMIEELMKDKIYKPMRFKELAGLLQVPKEERNELQTMLDELIKDGKIILDAKSRYKLPDAGTKIGTFSGNAKGFGFVTIEGEDDDIYVSADDKKGALDRDTVIIQIKSGSSGRRKEGIVLSVLEHANKEIVGTYERSKSYGFVISDNQKLGTDIYIPSGRENSAVTGSKVVVEVTDFGDGKNNPEGKIKEVLGHMDDPGVDVISIIKALNLPVDFPEDVMEQLEHIPNEVSEEEKLGRTDIRHIQTVTIDGEDAKDLDDAVTLEKKDNIYHLGVHIADVSHYVREGSALDKEALNRGTSVYLVDRVIPMLPHKLSNGICSLNQGVDRLALSCFMQIDEKGNVIGHSIENTLINVDRRMSYTAVNKIVADNDEATIKEYEELVPMFRLMAELADILKKKRSKRGAINFDFPESKILLDENGRPIDIKPYVRNTATDIIEDFMLITNETIAEDFFWQELPFLYRTHENPDQEKIIKLGIFINNFGYTLKGGTEIHPKEIQKLLTSIGGSPEEMLISRLALRSMKQARYTPECSGHFGLAAKYYCHFTSPIRRYPDLQIHRIIKENIAGKLSDKRINHYESILPDVALLTSRTERRADEAEREVDKMKKAEYMAEHIGEVYEGVISGVTAWGLYVELPNTVEGMIRLNFLMDDYYIFDEAGYRLVGEDFGREYKLGQRIKVRIDAVNLISRTIDMAPAL